MIARDVMRKLYCGADIGISGGNFAVAETGMISITENEGNARLTTSLPKVHIALIGMRKCLPRFGDLALFFRCLATAGAGQQLTCYQLIYSGPRRADEPDGPDELHVVLLDNGRTRLLADAEQRDALHCIRCGACLNVCPIFEMWVGIRMGRLTRADRQRDYSALSWVAGIQTLSAASSLVARAAKRVRCGSICIIICCRTGEMRWRPGRVFLKS